MFGLLSVYLFLPPYWALMDDWGQINSAAQQFEGKNLVQYLAEFVRGDFGWGMFRPVYGLFIYLFYGTFWKSSQLAYLFIYALNLGIFWAWGTLFEKTIYLFTPNIEKPRAGIFKWFFFIFCFLFSPNYTIFFFASLQERLILIFGAAAYYGMLKLAENDQTVRPGAIWLFAGTAFCLMSKASAIFLVPPFAVWLAILFWQKREIKFARLFLGIIALGAAFAYGLYSIRKGYTDQYLVSAMWDHWVQFGGRLHRPLLTCLIAAAFTIFCWIRLDTQRCVARLYSFLFWPLTMFCFALVMLPWRSVVNYYLIVPGGMFLTGCKLMICFSVWLLLAPEKRKWLIAVLLIICAVTSIPCARKVWKNARQHHGTGEVVQFLKQEFTQDELGNSVIWMPRPCIEASAAMSQFLRQPNLVRVLSNNDAFPAAEAGIARSFLMINGECSEIPKNFQKSREVFSYHPWYIYQAEKSQ